ncbi:MAG: cytochrome c family protein [Alphaproteobacteria bacterium]|nr:cytochrome c family protein [Alphaproteobacteria bacterium]
MRPILTAALLAASLAAPALAQAPAAGDAEAGQRVFAQCRACHTINDGGRNGVGPNLWNIYGRPAGAREGFRYSANLQELARGGLTWDEANLRRYLTNPKDLVPNGSMAFVGIRNPEQLTNLVAFLSAQRPAQ